MAAPMNFKAARGRLTLFGTNSKCFDIIRLAHTKQYKNSNKNKRNPKKNESGSSTKGKTATAGSESQNLQGTSKKFKDFLIQRRNEASHSMLVQTHHPERTLKKLERFGPLQYAGFTSVERSFILAQYKKKSDLDFLLWEGASHFAATKQFPMQSRLLLDMDHRKTWVGVGDFKDMLTGEYSQQSLKDRKDVSYQPNKSFDDEAIVLHSLKSLNDFDLRQRFFMCTMLEDTLQSILPEAQITPYGSCLNGFGWWNGDLDMMLSLDPHTHMLSNKTSTFTQNRESTRLKFTTMLFNTERQLGQRTLSAMSAIMEVMPLVERVTRILNARVPIVRFYSQVLSLQCDLSLHSMESMKMTETLYLLSASDPRIRPLLTTLKQWALHHQLTAGGEHQKPTTLGLLCMLIFYLQTCQPTILPSFRELQSLEPTSGRFEIDGLSYRLPDSPSSIPLSTNTQSIESLLHGFFQYFASFDFKAHGMSIIEGSAFPKLDETSSLYVENPYRVGLNICRNVSQSCVQNLQQAMTSGAQKMDEIARDHSSESGVSRLDILFDIRAKKMVHRTLDLDSVFDEKAENVTGEIDTENVVEETTEASVGTEHSRKKETIP